jgi:hypothetical protein
MALGSRFSITCTLREGDDIARRVDYSNARSPEENQLLFIETMAGEVRRSVVPQLVEIARSSCSLENRIAGDALALNNAELDFDVDVFNILVDFGSKLQAARR